MIRRVGPIVLVAALVGCAPAVPVASSEASEQSSDRSLDDTTPNPTPSQSGPPMTAPPSPPSASSPGASPPGRPSAAQYSDGDIVAVTGDGLAVRQGPGTAYTLLAAARWGEDGNQVLGSPYRLSAGEQLVVGQGPLVIDGLDWYGVMHTDDAIQWTPPDEPGSGIHGWIAANDGEAEFVRLVVEASVTCCFVESGVGLATTADVPTLPIGSPGSSRGFGLTVGHADPAGWCHVRVIDDADQVLLDETIVGWGNPGAWWPGEGVRLEIETKCSWSVRVGNFVG